MESSTNTKRNSFVFYRSYSEALAKIKDPLKMHKLLLAIIEYGLDMKEPEFDDDMLDLAWVLIKPTMDANYRNYLNGSKGGAPKGNQNAKGKGKNNQKQPTNNPKQPVVETTNNRKQGNDNDNVNVNANDNANVNAEGEKENKEKEIKVVDGMIYYPLTEGDEYDEEGWQEA